MPPLPPIPPLPSLPLPSLQALRKPRPSPSDEIHNYRMMRGDSVAMGALNAASTFLPVFVARIGGSAFEVGLLTAIPAVSSVLLAIPVGQVLQRRAAIVRWYSTARMLAHLSYVAMAIAILLVPPQLAVPAVLAIWAVGAVPQTIGIVSFPVVMDGAAGPRGRLEMMSRRWSIMGITTAISVALVGQVLDLTPFLEGYALVFAAFSIAGLVSWHFSRQYRVPSYVGTLPAGESLVARLRAMAAIVRGERPFLHYSARQLVYVGGVRLTLPLIPLYFVNELKAPDAWIGIIATAQSLALLVGYLFWRRQSRIRGPAFVLMATLLVSALYPAAISVTGSVVAVAALAAIASLFTAGVDLALFDELMNRIPRQYGVTFAAVDTMLVNGVTVLAPLLGATIAQLIGIHGALRLGTLVTLGGFVLFALEIWRRSREGPSGSVPVVVGNDVAGDGGIPTLPATPELEPMPAALAATPDDEAPPTARTPPEDPLAKP